MHALRWFYVCGSLFAFGGMVAAETAEVRPALLGNGRTSLINVMDAQRLLKRGQQDAVVSFSLGIGTWGYGTAITYEGSSNSDLLSQELLDAVERSKFTPARYQGKVAGALVNGTVVFAVSNGSPRLRIFLHQDDERLKRGDDFIAPQLVVPWDREFKWFDEDRYYRFEAGMVAVRISVDATGKLQSSQIVRVHPPGAPFGASVAKNIGTATFSPAYLNGRSVACSTVWMIPFWHPDRGKRWMR